jgi:hypothetical protein
MCQYAPNVANDFECATRGHRDGETKPSLSRNALDQVGDRRETEQHSEGDIRAE